MTMFKNVDTHITANTVDTNTDNSVLRDESELGRWSPRSVDSSSDGELYLIQV